MWEEKGAGLGIRVSPLGTKTWVFTYRAAGKPRFMTLGRYPETTVEKAHELHAKHRREVAEGADPGAAKVRQAQAERGAPTVATVVEEYIARYAEPRKRSWQGDARILRAEVLGITEREDIGPAQPWGTRKAKDITRRDVLELLDGIVNRGAPIMANRTFAALRKMFAWAVTRDLVPASPCVGIERPAEERQRDRVLTPAELATLWQALESLPATDRVPQALRLAIATAQRIGEILGATWQEFDFDAGWWTIPAERSKNGLAHRVPLTRTSRRILQDARLVLTSDELVFASPRGGALDRCAPSHWTRRNAPALELSLIHI
ncbi:MAG: integrase arm-type DNA-binding domain-containing protein [Candidatus Eisenbacteria bacterium]|nr:integrase arm-type DNA-binding domain-containing protein [Candidatus Eisenbacteria bacterium]